MAQCVASVQVNGSTVLAPVESVPCTSLVMLTPAEYEALSHNPFHLSMAEGGTVSAAVVGVWIIAYGAKEVTRLLRHGGETSG